MKKYSAEQMVYSDGIFAKNFPIKDAKLEKGNTIISQEEFEDIVYISDEFNFHFFNAGIMVNGSIHTYKVIPEDCEEVTTLGDILEKGEVDEKYFLLDEKLEKWIRNKQKSTYVRINEDWVKCDFKYPGWIKK